jgi:hypothetical protein
MGFISERDTLKTQTLVSRLVRLQEALALVARVTSETGCREAPKNLVHPSRQTMFCLRSVNCAASSCILKLAANRVVCPSHHAAHICATASLQYVFGSRCRRSFGSSHLQSPNRSPSMFPLMKRRFPVTGRNTSILQILGTF